MSEVDYTQYACTDCGKKGVCEDGMDVFVACICQDCFDKLWARYLQVLGVDKDRLSKEGKV
jgi:hypothetical protein